MASALNPIAGMLAAIFFAQLFDRAGPTPVQTISIPVVLWILPHIVSTTTQFLSPFTDVLVLVIGLALFLCFLRDATRGPSAGIALFLIVMTLISTLEVNAPALADEIARALPFAGIAAIIGGHVAALLCSDRETTPPEGALGDENQVTSRRLSRPALEAAGRTAIILPLVIWFITRDSVGDFVILVVALSVVRIESPEQGALGLFVGNVLGGLAALTAYWLIETIDSAAFDSLIYFGFVLAFGFAIAGGGARSAIARGGFATAVILLAVAFSPLDDGIGSAFLERVILSVAAAGYVVLGLCLVSSRSNRSAPDERTVGA